MLADRRLVLLLLLAGAAVLVLAGRVMPGSPAPAPAPAPEAELGAPAAGGTGTARSGPVVVHVVGAVRRPGVYRLPAGSRTRDAVRRAGGARPRADLAAVNLAALVADGEQVAVPVRAAPGAAPAAAPPVAPIVHLNSAAAAELDALDGIGPALAERIVAYRTQHGGFRSIDELDEVSGIGPARLEALRPRLAL
jgi:competence protein ComEA